MIVSAKISFALSSIYFCCCLIVLVHRVDVDLINISYGYYVQISNSLRPLFVKHYLMEYKKSLPIIAAEFVVPTLWQNLLMN